MTKTLSSLISLLAVTAAVAAQAAPAAPEAPAALPTGQVPNSWIVRLHDNATLTDHALAIGTDLEPTIESRFELVNGYAGTFNADLLGRIQRDPRVMYVEPDMYGSIAMAADEDDLQSFERSDRVYKRAREEYVDYNLAQISEPRQYSGENHYYSIPRSGEYVAIYILDTGIHLSHNDFQGRAQFGANFVKDEVEDDLSGHGTHVAACAMGTSYGTAKNAIAISVKVAGKDRVVTLQRVLKALDFVTKDEAKRRHESIDYRGSVINLSLEATASSFLLDDLNAAYKQGLVLVAAAGNDNKDACEVAPAKYKKVIAVASTDENYAKGSKSNWGRCVTISTAGVGIKSAWLGSNDATKVVSGTSQASPRVAGFAATIMSFEYEGGKIALPETVLRRITSNANFYALVGGGQSTNLFMNNGFWKGKPYLPYPGKQVPA